MPPRPNASTEEILVTTIRLIAEHDVSGISIDMVAERAGVSKATIYRRWASRSDLIAEALRYTRRPGANPNTGTLRGDLRELLIELVGYLNRPEGGRVMIALLNAAIRSPELAKIRDEADRDARLAYKKVIDRAIERGELDKAVDTRLMTDILIAPFLYQRLVEGTEARKNEIDRMIDTVIAGFERQPSATRIGSAAATHSASA